MAAPAHIARENGKKGGRPKGSTTKPRFSDFVTEAQIKELIEQAISMAKKGDSAVMRHLLDHSLGRPHQTNDVTTDGEKLTVVQLTDDQKSKLIKEAVTERIEKDYEIVD